MLRPLICTFTSCSSAGNVPVGEVVGMAGGVVEKEAAAKVRGLGRRRNAAAEAAVGPIRARANKKGPSMVGGACAIAGFGRAGTREGQ